MQNKRQKFCEYQSKDAGLAFASPIVLKEERDRKC